MGLALEAGLSLPDFWASTPRLVMVAWRAYERKRAWSAWFAGAPANFRDLTFEQLSGAALRKPDMSPEAIDAALGSIAAAHNAALSARAAQQGTPNDGQ